MRSAVDRQRATVLAWVTDAKAALQEEVSWDTVATARRQVAALQAVCAAADDNEGPLEQMALGVEQLQGLGVEASSDEARLNADTQLHHDTLADAKDK